MTAEDILKIARPEDLFAGDPAKAKKQYHELAKLWHPDLASDKDRANKVTTHLNTLYKEAVRRIDSGLWETESVLRIRDQSGIERIIQYQTKKTFELGHFYIADHYVTYVLEATHKDLFNNAVRTVKTFTYGSTKMENEISRYLPIKGNTFVAEDKRLVFQVHKTSDLLLLRDVLDHYDPLDPKHVAWIQSTLHNLSCYLSYLGLSHNDISPDTYFISPEHHSGALLGGWWYATKVGEQLRQIPRRTYNYLPWEVQSKKKASLLTDLELIRATGRELLGDITGKKLSAKIPEPMTNWLQNVATEDAVSDYREWGGVLKDSFGPKRFTEMKLDANTLYRRR